METKKAKQLKEAFERHKSTFLGLLQAERGRPPNIFGVADEGRDPNVDIYRSLQREGRALWVSRRGE